VSLRDLGEDGLDARHDFGRVSAVVKEIGLEFVVWPAVIDGPGTA
jgi:hypothetical protein